MNSSNKFEEDVRAYVADRRARMNEIAEGKIDFRDRSDAIRWLDRFAYANMIIINFAESVGMIDQEAAKGLRTESNNTRQRAERRLNL